MHTYRHEETGYVRTGFRSPQQGANDTQQRQKYCAAKYRLAAAEKQIASAWTHPTGKMKFATAAFASALLIAPAAFASSSQANRRIRNAKGASAGVSQHRSLVSKSGKGKGSSASPTSSPTAATPATTCTAPTSTTCTAGPSFSCYYPVAGENSKFCHCGETRCDIQICPNDTVWTVSNFGDGACDTGNP